MRSVKSVTELPLSKQTRTCTGDQHDHLQNSTEHEALISLANDMFGLYTWSHTVTHQSIGKCLMVAVFIQPLHFKTKTFMEISAYSTYAAV
jgi:hypothetical protein